MFIVRLCVFYPDNLDRASLSCRADIFGIKYFVFHVMRTRIARGHLLMLALIASAAVLSDQQRRLLALSSTKTIDYESDDQLSGLFPSTRMTTTNETNYEREQYGQDGSIVAPTLSDRNATMVNSQEGDNGEEEEEEEVVGAEVEAKERKPLPWSLPYRIRKSLPQQSSADFMNEIGGLKRSLNISLPWDDRSSLPTPIISLNLPKSATLTLYEYFKCGGLVSAHTFVNSSIRVGEWKPLAVLQK
jgi:hypothetical protein